MSNMTAGQITALVPLATWAAVRTRVSSRDKISFGMQARGIRTSFSAGRYERPHFRPDMIRDVLIIFIFDFFVCDPQRYTEPAMPDVENRCFSAIRP